MIHIEDRPINPAKKGTHADLADFIGALQRIEVGQSFLIPKLNAGRRQAISIMQQITGRKFTTASYTKLGYRVGRVS